MSSHLEISEKKIKILQAAARVFSSKGFHQAKMEEIAQEADVGKGTVYEYFPSKQNLFFEMFRVGSLFYQESLLRELKPELNIREKLETIVRLHLEFIQVHKDIGRMMMNESMPSCEEMKSFMLEVQQEKIDMLRGIFQEGIDAGQFRPVNPTLVAQLFFGAVHVMGMPLVCLDQQMDLLAVSAETVDVFLQGVEK